MERFQIWFRGVLCNVEGWIEPADYSVGIMGESFCVESLKAVDGSIEFVYDDSIPQTITDSDAREIDGAYWDSLFDPADHGFHYGDTHEYLGQW